ncbi:MAG: GNAT family N-acetyltransferase [Candidatus Lokiarchaeota archaeon]|nr:GNAT family N-acetyltransferase [Candidatus Lokiarchaeota archaeon]
MNIRIYKMDDYKKVKALMEEFTKEMGSDFEEKRFKSSLNRRYGDSLNNKGMIIAEEGDKIMGMVMCEVLVSSSTVETYGSIVNFVVAKEARYKGIGNALIEAAVKFFTEMGVKRIETNVRDIEKEGKLFIERYQFRKKYIVLERDIDNIYVD